MKFYVGQKVSLLHDSGEGTVVSVIDKHHVEVDFGDDFPFDVHVDEIIPVDPEEEKYFIKENRDEPAAATVSPPQVLGINLQEISLAIVQEDEANYTLSLLNPEATDALYTVYCKRKHKYEGLAYGKVDAGGKDKIAAFKDVAFHDLKSLYFQVLFYRTGTGLPIAPLVKEIPLNKSLLATSTAPIQPLNGEGWLFSLRQTESTNLVVEQEEKEDWVKNKKGKVRTDEERVIDLHIEELTIFPHQLAPSEMLEIQLEHFERSLSQALIDNVGKLILIHGVGEGKLRAEIRNRLKASPQVRQYYPASPARFGNGATEVILG